MSLNHTCRVHKSNDHDLWLRFLDVLSMSRHKVRLIHVHSHQDYDGQPEWKTSTFFNNDVVDGVASQALCTLPAHVLEFHRQAAFDVQHLMFVKQHLHQHYVRVGQFSIAKPLEKAKVGRPQPVMTRSLFPCLNLPFFLRSTHQVGFSLRDGIEFLHGFRGRVAPPNRQASEYVTGWVSWYELLRSFQLSSGCRGVISTSSHNTWALDDLKREYTDRIEGDEKIVELSYSPVSDSLP